MYEHLNEDLLLEKAEIGRFDGYKILIFGSEGPIPHFHIESVGENIYSCVKILEDDYFLHGKYLDRLNRSVSNKLKKFLISPHRIFGKHGYNNWQIICIYWNDNNPNYVMDLDSIVMPEYNNL